MSLHPPTISASLHIDEIQPSAPPLPPDETRSEAFNPGLHSLTPFVDGDLDDVPSFMCPITQHLMCDPVTTSDGHSYERDAIEEWFRDHDTSPMTNTLLPDKSLKPNILLRNAIEEYHVGKFKLLKKHNLTIGNIIGTGSFKTVHAGEMNMREFGKPRSVAISRFRGGSGDIVSEVKILLKLGRHPRLVRYYGMCLHAEDQLLVTERAIHGSLDVAMEHVEDDMSLAHQGVILRQISQGMEALSEESIVHNDLALRNILLFVFRPEFPHETSVKISDFGLAASMYGKSNRTITNSARPIRYMPPESIEKNRFSEKSDVWSYGVLGYELLSRGRLPYFEMASDDRVVEYVLAGGRLSRPAEATSDDYSYLWNTILACWSAKPKDRPTFSCLVNRLGDVTHRVVTNKIRSDDCGQVDRANSYQIKKTQNSSVATDLNDIRQHTETVDANVTSTAASAEPTDEVSSLNINNSFIGDESYTWDHNDLEAINARREDLLRCESGVEQNSALQAEWIALLKARANLVALEFHTEDTCSEVAQRVIVMERMRYLPGVGFSHTLLPTDSEQCWSLLDNKGSSAIATNDFNPGVSDVKHHFNMPPKGFQWLNAWSPTKQPEFGVYDGWMYASSFTGTFKSHKENSSLVRQRSWQRIAIQVHKLYDWEKDCRSKLDVMTTRYNSVMSRIDCGFEAKILKHYIDMVKQSELLNDSSQRPRSNLDHALVAKVMADYQYSKYLPNSVATMCMGGLIHSHTIFGRCQIQFNIVKRRHHCRICGLVLCSACCSEYTELPPSFKITGRVRVCILCYELCRDGTIGITVTPTQMIEYRNRCLESNKPISREAFSHSENQSTIDITNAVRNGHLSELGLQSNIEADTNTRSIPSQAAIRKAYHRLMREFHPDKQQQRAAQTPGYSLSDDKDRIDRIQCAYAYLTRADEDIAADDEQMRIVEVRKKNIQAYEAHSEYATVYRSVKTDDYIDECPVCHRAFSFMLRRRHCPKCNNSVCRSCSRTVKPHPTLNIEMNWCDTCVQLIEIHGPIRLYPMIQGYQPLKGHAYLESIDIGICVTCSRDESEFLVQLFWQHHDECAHQRGTSAVATEDQREVLRGINHCFRRSMDDFKFLDNQLRYLLKNTVAAHLPSRSWIQSLSTSRDAITTQKDWTDMLTTYSRYVLKDSRLAGQLTVAKQNSMSENEILSMQLVRAFFSANSSAWSSFRAKSEKIFHKSLFSLSSFDLQTMEYFDNLDKYCSFLIEVSVVDRLLSALDSRIVEQTSRIDRCTQRTHKIQERQNQTVVQSDDHHVRMQSYGKRLFRHQNRLTRELERKSNQQAAVGLFHVSRECDDNEFNTDNEMAQEDHKAFRDLCEHLEVFVAQQREASLAADNDALIYEGILGKAIPGTVIDWFLQHRSVAPLQLIENDTVNLLIAHRKKLNEAVANSVSLSETEGAMRNKEKTLWKDFEAIIPKIKTQISDEQSLIEAETKNLKLERSVRSDERLCRHSKELEILYDLEHREKEIYEMLHQMEYQQSEQASRVDAALKRNLYQSDRKERTERLAIEGSDTERLGIARLELERARCNAQFDLHYVLVFDRTLEDTERKTCDSWYESAAEFNNTAQQTNAGELCTVKADNEASQSELDMLGNFIKLLDEGNPRTIRENDLQCEVDADFSHLQNRNITLADNANPIFPEQLGDSDDINFELQIARRRCAIDITLVQSNSDTSTTRARLNDENVRITLEYERLKAERAANRSLGDLLARIQSSRDSEQCTISNEIGKAESKRSDIRDYLLECMKSIKTETEISKDRQQSAVDRLNSTKMTISLLNQEEQMSSNRCLDMARLNEAKIERVERLRDDLAQQRVSDQRLYFPRNVIINIRNSDNQRLEHIHEAYLKFVDLSISAKTQHGDGSSHFEDSLQSNISCSTSCHNFFDRACERWSKYNAFVSSSNMIKPVTLPNCYQSRDCHDVQFVQHMTRLHAELNTLFTGAKSQFEAEKGSLVGDELLRKDLNTTLEQANIQVNQESGLHNACLSNHALENDLIEADRTERIKKEEKVLRMCEHIDEFLEKCHASHEHFRSKLAEYESSKNSIWTVQIEVRKFVDLQVIREPDRWNAPLLFEDLSATRDRYNAIEATLISLNVHFATMSQQLSEMQTIQQGSQSSTQDVLDQLRSILGNEAPLMEDDWLKIELPLFRQRIQSFSKSGSTNQELISLSIQILQEISSEDNKLQIVLLEIKDIATETQIRLRRAEKLENERKQDERAVEQMLLSMKGILQDANSNVEMGEKILRACSSTCRSASACVDDLQAKSKAVPDAKWNNRKALRSLVRRHEQYLGTLDRHIHALSVQDTSDCYKYGKACEKYLKSFRSHHQQTTKAIQVLCVGASGEGKHKCDHLQNDLKQLSHECSDVKDQLESMKDNVHSTSNNLRIILQDVKNEHSKWIIAKQNAENERDCAAELEEDKLAERAQEGKLRRTQLYLATR